MNYSELLKISNDKALPEYKETIEIIRSMSTMMDDCKGDFIDMIRKIVARIIKADDFLNEYSDSYYKSKDIAELEAFNSSLYTEIEEENYLTSYANPEYAVSIFGDKLGQLMSSFYIAYRHYFLYIIENNVRPLVKLNHLLLDMITSLREDKKDFNSLLKIYSAFVKGGTVDERELGLQSFYNPENKGAGKIVMNADLSDIRYLYQYGKKITSNEIKTAEFLNSYPDEKIDILVAELTKAYLRGFELAKKDLTIKDSYYVVYNIGQEKIIRALVKNLEKYNLKPLFGNPSSTSINKQYGYDHRFDHALYYDEEMANKNVAIYKEATERIKPLLRKYSGVIAFDSFGEKAFSPKAKKENLKLSEAQQKISQKASIESSQISQQYTPRTETSFTIIGFPVPEIGDKFEEIFDETLKINMIDTLHWEEVQQKILDVLDFAEYVHVKGKNGNRTDIKVKMQVLNDPSKETNFVNCGADVNIPVGELFTSPMLEGTNGILHVKESYLNNITFKDLELVFKDGYVADYSCANMSNPEDGKKLIQEDLLFPHKTLPLGEFAIGTNTPAYIMAKKYDILNLLPILIVEKMGPHFAIGDTCFSWEEDFAVFNPIDGKEITARENSHSAKRKSNIQEAYTNCHTDITLPYEDLDFITVITKDGKKLDIIRDGKFTVEGSEELNIPLDEYGL
ncbi:MAG: hypothetical protein B6226_05175 [Candidatus Cloacimonetes bacterium 4572_65]|nr:MAG: hypothetical protein B6226_05175 [Candidatus Cloacimonetes bacterium 4572_65]